MGFDQFPIDHLITEEWLDMCVVGCALWAVKGQVFPIANAWHQFDTQQGCQTKDREILPLRICVNGCGFDGGAIANESIQNIDRFPDPTGNEVAEEKDVRIADMVIGNPPIASIANMLFGQQVLLGQLVLCSVGGYALLIAPVV